MECSICLTINDEYSVCPYTCEHKFHTTCAQLWTKNCPLCRSQTKNIMNRFDKMYNNCIPLCHNIDDYSFNANCKSHNVKIKQSPISPYGAVIFCFDCRTIEHKCLKC